MINRGPRRARPDDLRGSGGPGQSSGLPRNGARQSPVTPLFSSSPAELSLPCPVLEQAGLSIEESDPPCPAAFEGAQPLVFLPRPAHQVGIDASQKAPTDRTGRSSSSSPPR